MAEFLETNRVVIVGAGLGALYAALELSPLPVLMISPVSVGSGASSAWAQGGVAAAMAEYDSPEAHAEDTIAAGAGVVDPEIAALVTSEARNHILELAALGTPFDRDAEGRYVLNHEAAHSAPRVVRVRGDQAGSKIMERLLAAVSVCPSVQILEGVVATGLCSDSERVHGVELMHANGGGERRQLLCPAVLLAGGGVGGLYAKTTNPREIRGEVLGLAIRAGAEVRDAEFVQFHPTAIDLGLDPCPLATEALRGAGGLLLNSEGERFVLKADPRGELAPRDIVARSIFAEEQAGRAPVLDVRSAIGSEMAERFPTVTASCLRGGIDPAHEPIPVTVAAHYHMGGVAADAWGRTSLSGLWACGEVACTGLHGANRLASNGLLEALVFARRAASDIVKTVQHCSAEDKIEIDFGETAPDVPHNDAAIASLRDLMSRDVGVVRTQVGLERAVHEITRLMDTHTHDIRFLNMCYAALAIAEAALAREASCGSHFRADECNAIAQDLTQATVREPT